jgi:hypothetical protein
MDVKNEAFLPLFGEVKELLAPYALRLTARRDEPGYLDLWSEKDVEIDGRRRSDVFFCGLIIQKSYVGFYFMPLYADQERSLVFGPELLATLRGKSCFHLTRMTPEIREQLRGALAAGWRLYEERGWV